MKRETLSTNTRWEKLVGYSRAVKVGNTIHVAGTAATGPSGEIVGSGDSYIQTLQCIKNIRTALGRFGCTLENVVRTRIFVVNIGDWEEVGKAHGEFFKDIKPVTTMVGVRGLIESNMLVEIEADAVID
ncbi:MAG: RidA family protein [Caldithrix sp.]|nr:RidA family protein [Caldithrix sp.]